MTDSSPLNPYAPSHIEDDRPTQWIDGRSQLSPSTLRVVLATYFGIICSGSVFGAALGGFVIVAGAIGNGDGFAISGWESLVLFPFAVIYGGMIAGIAGVPIVGIGAFFGLLPLRGRPEWQRHQTRRFASVCGFLSGFLSVFTISGFSPWGLLLGLVPAAFGCVGTLLFVIKLVRHPDPETASKREPDATLVDPTLRNVI